MLNKKGLGRGLGALLPSDGEGQASAQVGESIDERIRFLGRVAEIDIDRIRPNPYQPRQEFDDGALDELAHSIGQLGVIQPVTVRSMGDHQFEIISGERRLRAARRAGLSKIPAYVREADTEAMLEMAIVENVQRQDLNPIEVALSYQRLMEECGLRQEDVATKVSKNRATVANMLRLLKLPPRVQAALRDGSVSIGHARALITLDDQSLQNDLVLRIQQEGLSVRDVEELARKAKEAPTEEASPKPAGPPLSADVRVHLAAVKDRLRNRLATLVDIKHRGEQGGKIEIAYYSTEDLNRLLEVLQV